MQARDLNPRTEPQVGATEELSLRVSTAVLTKTTFRHPESGESMLVLERKAVAESTSGGFKEKLQAQPLGGASRLVDPAALGRLVDQFNYDSAESKSEGDFRIQIKPGDWPRVRDFCVKHFMDPSTGAIEANPERELAEELGDSLGVEVNPTDYSTRNLGIVLRGGTSTDRVGVSGQHTVRAFNIYHVEITGPTLIAKILENSSAVSDQSLINHARAKAAASGKKGKATALLALPLSHVVDAFAARDLKGEWPSITVAGHIIADNVPAIFCEELPEVPVTR